MPNKENAWEASAILHSKNDDVFRKRPMKSGLVDVQLRRMFHSRKSRYTTIIFLVLGASLLGGGFKYCLYSPLLGGNDPFWLIFFQKGWNHQLVYVVSTCGFAVGQDLVYCIFTFCHLIVRFPASWFLSRNRIKTPWLNQCLYATWVRHECFIPSKFHLWFEKTKM